MPPQNTLYDIVVVGGGVAGATAALAAAKAGSQVCLISRPVGKNGWIDWLHPAAFELLSTLGIATDELSDAAIDSIEFRSDDLSQSGAAKVTPCPLVHRDQLCSVLIQSAKSRGATVVHANATPSDAQDDNVRISTDHAATEIRGRIVIIADGSDSQAGRELGFSTDASRGDAHVLQCSLESDPKAKAAKSASLMVRFMPGDPPSFFYLLQRGADRFVGVVHHDTPESAATLLQQSIDKCQSAGLLDGKARIRAAHTRSRHAPRGRALLQDSHVIKRGIVIGDAGGFVSAMSHDGLHPAIVSGNLAASVATEALNDPHPQDALSKFDQVWRHELADYLRLPGNDMRFLLPLVFSNQAIAERMARAFMLGENI